MIEILMKICAKITIIVVKNREPYYFIIIYKCKEVLLSLFSYQMLASTFDSDEWSSYYKVYGNYLKLFFGLPFLLPADVWDFFADKLLPMKVTDQATTKFNVICE